MIDYMVNRNTRIQTFEKMGKIQTQIEKEKENSFLRNWIHFLCEKGSAA